MRVQNAFQIKPLLRDRRSNRGRGDQLWLALSFRLLGACWGPPGRSSTASNRPGRGDFLANILLYMPLGLFSAVALTERARPAYRLLVVQF